MQDCCTPGGGHGRPGSDSSKIHSRGKTPGLEDFISHSGGSFLMGAEDSEGFPADGEGPVRKVTLSPFSISKYSVTNEHFTAFINDTGYKTESERFSWSFVFHLHVPKHLVKKGVAKRVPGLQWWLAVEGAYWNKPEGPGSSTRSRMNHPVTHVSFNDAQAYCQWAGVRLPTEAEWEYAARGGLEQKRYVWGNELTPGGKHMCNIFQGNFPEQDLGEDGYQGTCPVNSFKPNEFGLYNMAGNVWEWCSDWFDPSYHITAKRMDPQGPPSGTARVMKGGSFLCHHSYCNRYRVAARTSNTPDSATGNLGFRVVLNSSD